jgi:hypothetical protein
MEPMSGLYPAHHQENLRFVPFQAATPELLSTMLVLFYMVLDCREQ